MLIDHVTLTISAGKGGDGVVRWRREKGIPYGGPAGGDGGKGGDVYLRVIRDVHVLGRYAQKKDWSADAGEAGQKRSMHGSGAEDLYMDIPVGSIVHNKEYDIFYECNTEGETFRILKGGKGGLGNEKFKSSTNRTPMEFTKGTPGEYATFDVELRLFAHVGFIGFPNAGKSSLLNALTRSGAKVADYAFTTLEPNLGAFHGYILADIPGLIEGAAEGKGLGHKFLRHITRTQSLVHLVSASDEDVRASYKTIRAELGKFDNELLEKDEILVLSQADRLPEEEVVAKAKSLAQLANKEVITLSLFDDNSVKSFEEKFRVHLDGLVISVKPLQLPSFLDKELPKGNSEDEEDLGEAVDVGDVSGV